MNLVRKLILKRFLNRNICFLRHAKSEFQSSKSMDIHELVKNVPQPEWWMLDEDKFNRLKKLLNEVEFEQGLLEPGFKSRFMKEHPGFNPLELTSVATPGVYFHNVLGDAVPLHVVRFEHEGQDWLFLPLHHPAIQKENAA